MILELAGDSAVDGPVRRVVRAHGQFVDQQAAVPGFEQLDGENTDDIELGGNGERHSLRFEPQLLRKLRRGRHDLEADPVPLDGFDHRVGDGLPRRRPGYDRGQLTAKVDQLLGHDRHAGEERLGCLGERIGRSTPPCRRIHLSSS